MTARDRNDAVGGHVERDDGNMQSRIIARGPV